jgi:hypothetical protein
LGRTGEPDRDLARATDAKRREASRVAGSNGLLLAPWHRRLVFATALGLAVTGLLWTIGDQGLGFFPELDGSAARSRMHLLLMAHGVLAYGGAVVLGSLLGRHIPAGLRSGRRAVTGITALSLVGALLLTALLLYYAGSDTLRSVSSAAHQVLGVAAVAVLCVHLTRRERPRTPSRPRR